VQVLLLAMLVCKDEG